MVWDEQRADNQKWMEELRAQDVAPTAGLSRHPGFGEFGRKTKSHQILFFSISEFQCLLLPAGLEIPQKQMLQCSTFRVSNTGRNQT